MARRPTSDILTDDVIYRKRRDLPPDGWKEAASA